MNNERWQRIDDLFHHAAGLEATERSAYLREVAGDDAVLVAELRSLLRAHDADAPFLETPAHGGVSRLLQLDANADVADPIGSRLGAWRITRFLATGGMGAVYLAERDDRAYHKTVAIKLAHRSLLGSSLARRGELERRFEIERQVLANLEHPYIARLIDGGTSADGRPYFVMEFVEGLPIDEHCERRNLSLRDRLGLFARVCEAVQHAHQNLVIHRDLKPGNILVTEEGGPKLLDFGLAKMLDPHGSAAATAATVACEFMGTFAYAAPEQVANTGHAPDTRSDVYALGMVLYRLIAGQHPYDVSGPMTEALQRIATQTPDAPSKHQPAADDELDTITLKALAKDPERRYASAGDLRADLERYLRGEAIHAKGDSGWYVLRKSLRRHRTAASIAVAFVTLVTVFAIFAAFQTARLARQKATLAESLRVSNIERGRAMGLVGNTALAEQLIWREYLESPDASPASGVHDRLAHWALWELYSNEPCLRTIDSGAKSHLAMACSSDERWLALMATDRMPFVLDAATGERVCSIEQKASAWRSLAFQPNSSLLAVAGEDGAAGIWDVQTGACVQRLVHDQPLIALDFTADAAQLATITGHAAAVWDVALGEQRWSCPIIDASTIGVAISPDGASVAVAADDGRVRLIDGATGELLATVLDRGRRCVNVAFSPDGRLLAADTGGTHLALIHVPSRQVVARLDDSTGWVRAVAFHPTQADPYLLAAAGFDKSLHVWEVPASLAEPPESSTIDLAAAGDACRLIRSFNAHSAAICAMSFTGDGQRILSAGLEPGVRLWELTPHACRSHWADTEQAFDILATPDGRHVITAGGVDRNLINIRDANTGEIVRSLSGHAGLVSSISLSPDGTRLASSSYDRTICIWALESTAETPLWRSGPHAHQVNAVSWSADGREVAAASDSGEICIHRAADGAEVQTLPLDCDRIPSMRLSGDGRFLAAAIMPQNVIVLIDRRNGERVDLTGHDQAVRIVRFSPDSSLLASAGDDLTIRIWSLPQDAPPACVLTMSGHHQDIFALAFAPDGGMLASGGRGGVIRLFSVVTGRCLVTLPGDRDMIFNAAFSADGTRLFSVGRSRSIAVWDLGYYDDHIAENRWAFERLRGAAAH